MTHFLVDDLQSFNAAGAPKGEIWSCSTGLPYLVPDGTKVRSPERLPISEELETLWERAFGAADAMRTALSSQFERREEYRHVHSVVGPQLYGNLLTFGTKALTLAAWRSNCGASESVVIGCPNLLPVEGLNIQVGRHDHVFAAIADKLDGPMGVRSVSAINRDFFAQTFDSVPTFDKVFNILNRSASAIAYQVWRRAARRTPFHGRGTLVIASESDAIEECFVSLVRAGWKIVRLGTPIANVRRGATQDIELPKSVADIWRKFAKDLIAEDVADAAGQIFLNRLSAAMSVYPSWLNAMRSTAREIVASYSGASGRLVVVGNGFYAPSYRLLDRCVRDLTVPVVCLEHGAGKGLGDRHDYTVTTSTTFADTFIAYNDETKYLHDKFQADRRQSTIVSGAPKTQYFARFPKIQRFFARKYLGVESRKPLLIYVSSLTTNNVPQGYGTCTDAAYADFQRELLEIFAEFPGNVVVKPYPAHRFADPEQIWHMPLPPNTRLAPFGEFRHIRWAADILLLDLCSSTLGWAMGSNIPIVYVDNVSNPMTERAAIAARSSLFYVDASVDEWRSNLSSVLGRPIERISQDWLAMADERREFERRFVLGPRNQLAGKVMQALDGALSDVSCLSNVSADQRMNDGGCAHLSN